MNWICIGLIAGSLVASAHSNQESCEGRMAMLRKIEKADVAVKCIDMSASTTFRSGAITTIPPEQFWSMH
jgi:hypothetical protein